MKNYGMGQSVARFEDLRLLRGGGQYVADVSLPYTTYAYILRSPHANAKINKVDVARATNGAGVQGIFVAQDWQASGHDPNLPRASGRKKRDGSPMYRPPYPVMADDHVRYIGEPVALIVADTQMQAMDAAELIEVDYEPLDAVTTTDKARDVTAVVWGGCPDNICFVHLQGNKEATEAAFAGAAHIVKQRFAISRVTAATMEPRGCVGLYNEATGEYTVYATPQRAHAFREELAGLLKVSENMVRVIAGDIGGSFGMKSPVYNEVALVLLAARKLGRPVKWVSTRTEAFLSDANGRDVISEGELALDSAGKFLGLKVRNIANVGAYLQSSGDAPPVANLGTLAGVYTLPAIHVDVTAIFSNTHPVRPYRGNGRPEAAYVIERLIDIAADELAIDPAEIRRRNLIPADAMPYKTALDVLYDCGEFERNMDIALQMADYAGFEKRRSEARGRGKLRGIGISNSIERAAAPGYEAAEIRFDRTGSITIFSGAVSQGQGHETTFKQIVCDRLQVAPERIKYVQGDTEKVFFGEGTGGSRTATIGGAAMLSAADKVLAKAKGIVARMLDVPLDAVQFADGLFSASNSNRSLSWEEVARASLSPKNLPAGEEPGLLVKSVYYNESINYPNGTHVCELEIDEDTGTVQMCRYNVVDDVGNVLNPLLLHGQIIGGVAQAVGQVLMEQILYDENDQLVTASFLDYAMPRAEHFSAINVKSSPVPTATNPLGVKGAGEAGCVGAFPAVANALVDALSPYGIRHVEMPATPESLWRLMSNGRK